jgi:hypothetical protein
MSLMMRNPNVYYGNGRRRTHRIVRRRGGNIFSTIHDFVKKNKLVSGISGLLSNIPGPVGTIASAINKGSSALGYGRRRVIRRRSGMGLMRLRRAPRRRMTVRRHGGAFNLRSALSSAHGFVKKHQLASKLLGHLGHSKLAGIAAHAGYGMRRRTVRRRRRVGGAFNLRSALSSAHGFVKKHQLASKLLGHLGHSKLAGIAAHAGYGRRRTVRRRPMGHGMLRMRRCGGANFFSLSQIAAPKF